MNKLLADKRWNSGLRRWTNRTLCAV